MFPKLEVDHGQDQVVAAGPDKVVPGVIRVGKLRYYGLTERRVFVEGEALADEIQNANFHELKRIQYCGRAKSIKQF